MGTPYPTTPGTYCCFLLETCHVFTVESRIGVGIVRQWCNSCLLLLCQISKDRRQVEQPVTLYLTTMWHLENLATSSLRPQLDNKQPKSIGQSANDRVLLVGRWTNLMDLPSRHHLRCLALLYD